MTYTNKYKMNVSDKKYIYQFQEKREYVYVFASEKRENYLINARIA